MTVIDMAEATKIHHRSLFRVSFDQPRPVVLPDAEYEAVLVKWRVGPRFQSYGLFIIWRIVSPGEHNGKILPSYFNVLRVGKKEGRSFKAAGWQSKFAQSYQRCFGFPQQLHQFAPDDFASHVVKIRTRTSRKGYGGKEKPPESVVEELLGLST